MSYSWGSLETVFFRAVWSSIELKEQRWPVYPVPSHSTASPVSGGPRTAAHLLESMNFTDMSLSPTVTLVLSILWVLANVY